MSLSIHDTTVASFLVGTAARALTEIFTNDLEIVETSQCIAAICASVIFNTITASWDMQKKDPRIANGGNTNVPEITIENLIDNSTKNMKAAAIFLIPGLSIMYTLFDTNNMYSPFEYSVMGFKHKVMRSTFKAFAAMNFGQMFMYTSINLYNVAGGGSFLISDNIYNVDLDDNYKPLETEEIEIEALIG
jgi:hypothetical protein